MSLDTSRIWCQPCNREVDLRSESAACPHLQLLFCAWPAGVTGGGKLIPCRKKWGHDGHCAPIK